jgi:hypothetical protein
VSPIESDNHVPVRSPIPGLVGTVLLSVSAIGASAQSFQLEQQLCKLHTYYSFPASSNRDRRRSRFRLFARQWREDTQWQSSTTSIAMHPAYQAIIGMGADALPMILSDLRNNSGHWYWALKAISNEDPVPPANRGNIPKMRAAWLRWAEQKGIQIDDDLELAVESTSPFPVVD